MALLCPFSEILVFSYVSCAASASKRAPLALMTPGGVILCVGSRLKLSTIRQETLARVSIGHHALAVRDQCQWNRGNWIWAWTWTRLVWSPETFLSPYGRVHRCRSTRLGIRDRPNRGVVTTSPADDYMKPISHGRPHEHAKYRW